MRRTREVAELAELPCAAAYEAGILRHRVERLAVHVVHRDEPEERARGRGAVRHPAAHERRLAVVVAEVAERLDEVLLEVLETVAVEVEVADGTGARIPEGRVRVGVAGEGCDVLALAECGVHAGRDVHARGARRRVRVATVSPESVVSGADLRDRLAERRALQHACLGTHACVAHLPRVGKKVEVRVDGARVHAATADTERTVILGPAVDERERVRSAAVRGQLHRVVEDAGVLPGSAFRVVADVVAVRIAVPRIGREELVEPAVAVSRMVLVDGRDLGLRIGVGLRHERHGVRVGVAGIRAGVLAGERQRVAVNLQDAVLLEVRVEAHVELPAVRHAVAVGVSAVRLVGECREGARLLAVGGGGRTVVTVCLVGIADVRVGAACLEYLADAARAVLLPVRKILGKVSAQVHVRRPARRHVAVLQQEVLVEIRVRLRVDRTARLARALRVGRVHVRIPAVADAAVHVHAPARARIEAVLRAHLLVDERELLIQLYDNVRDVDVVAPVDRGSVERLGDADELLERVGRASLHPGLVNHFPLAAVLRDERGAGVAVAIDGDGHGVRAVLDDRRRLAAAVDQALAVVGHSEHAPVGQRDEGVVLADLGPGHVVLVGVRVGIRIVALHDERVKAAHHLPVIADSVAVRVPVDRVRADGELLKVGKAVVIRVALGDVRTRGVRVERGRDVLGGYLLADRDVLELEARTLEALQLPVLHPSDVGMVPEVVLVAVGQTVLVGVVHRRVSAVLGRPVGIESVDRIPCVRLCLGEVPVGDPGACRVASAALQRVGAVVEALPVAAQL